MKQDTWEKLEKMFVDAPEMRAESVSYQEIDKVAQENGFKLPEDYREFIHRYGGATVGPYSILGLRAADTMGNDEESVFEATKRFRLACWQGAEDWLVVPGDHVGNPVGMDQNGAIWISDHDNGSIDKIADDFEEYLRTVCLGLRT